jgi:hypothetical protein
MWEKIFLLSVLSVLPLASSVPYIAAAILARTLDIEGRRHPPALPLQSGGSPVPVDWEAKCLYGPHKLQGFWLAASSRFSGKG